MDETKQKIRAFLARSFRKRELQDDEEIFAAGFSSLFAMQLVLFLEKEFQVRVENKDLNFANFRSISVIADFVRSKRP